MLFLCVILQADSDEWPATAVDEGLAARCADARARPGTARHQPVSAHHVSAMLCADFSAPDEMTRSSLEHRHRREPLEPVGAWWEHGGNPVSPAIAGAGVLHGECTIAQQRFDPRPLVSRRDTGPQVPPGLHARRVISPLIRSLWDGAIGRISFTTARAQRADPARDARYALARPRTRARRHVRGRAAPRGPRRRVRARRGS
jgi:hypothetical protein